MAAPKLSGYFPSRPAIPVALSCGMLFWAGCAAAYSSGSGLDSGECAAWALPFAIACAGSLALSIWRRGRMVALALAALASGAFLGWGGAAEVHALGGQALEQPSGRAVFTLVDDSRKAGFSDSAHVSFELADGRTALAQADIVGYADPLFHGDKISASASFSAIDFQDDGYAWREGACVDVKLSNIQTLSSDSPIQPLRDLRVRVIEAIGDENLAHALLQALVCGYRRSLSGTEAYEAFKQCGLAHLVAVSGAHLVIVTSLFASLLRKVGTPRRFTVAALLIVMLSYLVLSGFPLSAIRATIMSSVGILALVGRRRPSSGNALGIGIFLMVGASPDTSLSVSFTLSALSTLGIVLFAPLFMFWLERTPLRHAYFAVEALSLTFSSSMLSLPFSVSLFSALPLVAPLANVACAPLFPLVCGLGLIAGMVAALSLPVSGLFLGLASSCASLLIGVVDVLANIPYCAVPAALDTLFALALSTVASLVVWAWWPRPHRKTGIVAAAAVVLCLGVALAQIDFGDSIVMLDVGQGDAILVRSQGKTLLVDTGNQDAKLLRELGRNHIVRLDGVLITHADDDHCGSLDVLSRYVQVGQVFVAQDMTTSEGEKPSELREQIELLGCPLVGLRLRDEFSVGAIGARVVWPRAFQEDGGNADSLCILLEFDAEGDGKCDLTALLTGDAEKDEIAAMLESGLVGHVDLLKVGHHGSRNGTTLDQMKALGPKVALISCGANNRYGHPAAEVIAELDDIGCETYRTDRDGEVACMLGASGLGVSKLG